MKITVLILAIIGSILAIALGACSGVCLAFLGDMAKDGGEGSEQGGMFLLFGVLQAVIGVVVGILCYNKMNRNVKINIFLKLGLFVAAGLSITNTFVALSAGACHVIAGIIVCLYKPEAKQAIEK